MTTVTMATSKATYLVQTLTTWGHADDAHLADATPTDPDMANVDLTTGALKLLARLDEEADGHFDGASIWIAGTDYPVTAK